METLIIRNGKVVCSTWEAKKWAEDDYMPVMPTPGDAVARINGNGVMEIGRVGIGTEPLSQPDGGVANIHLAPNATNMTRE